MTDDAAHVPDAPLTLDVERLARAMAADLARRAGPGLGWAAIDAYVRDLWRDQAASVAREYAALTPPDAPPTLERRLSSLEQILRGGIEAWGLTREYVGEDLLPQVWFDWYERARQALADLTPSAPEAWVGGHEWLASTIDYHEDGTSAAYPLDRRVPMDPDGRGRG